MARRRHQAQTLVSLPFGARRQLPPPCCVEIHLCDLSRPELTAQYLLVVDALNFCFWRPGEEHEEFEYADLARGVKARCACCIWPSSQRSAMAHYSSAAEP